jgi:aspartate/methionine/tyrosine aminotransferase
VSGVRLGAAYSQVTAALDSGGVPHFPAEAGFFVVCDMRRFMTEVSWEAEDALWRRLLEEANVSLTPGAACHVGEPGFMRLCFASEPTDAVVAGVERISGVLERSTGS